MPLTTEDIARLVANVPGVRSVEGNEIVFDFDVWQRFGGVARTPLEALRPHLPPYAHVTGGWMDRYDQEHPDRCRVQIHTDEHLTALAGLYGIERRRGSIPTVNIMVPGSISKVEVQTSLKPDPEYLSRYDRAEVV